MVQAEGEVEGRIAVPGAFRIEKHRSTRANEDVLRADVAVHEAQSGACRALHERLELRFKVAMGEAGGDQIGLEADGMEDRVGGKALGNLRTARGRRVDGGERGADLRGE